MCLVAVSYFTKILTATCSFIPFSCEKFTASVLLVPSATFVTCLLAVLILPVVICETSVITKPVASTFVFSPNVMLFNAISLAKLNMSLFSSCLSLLTLKLLTPDEKFIVLSSIHIFSCLTSNRQFPTFFLTTSSKSCNCLRFTASVGLLPAAAPIICCIIFLLGTPILTTSSVLFH